MKKLTEKQRSAARRKAGRRLELKHTGILRRLRKEIQDADPNRRTERVRAELIKLFREEYYDLLKEETDAQLRASSKASRN